MGQKIHPIGFRLGVTKEHLSRWYASNKRYPEVLQEDYKIRQFFAYKKRKKDDHKKDDGRTDYSKAGISAIRIDRKADQIDLEIHTSRPGMLVKKGGQGIEELRKNLQELLGSNRQIRINVIEVNKPDADAALIAEFIAEQLEKRVSFRRVVRQAIDRSKKADALGIKVQVSGRLNGAEIARTEWIREGRVPLHTLRADIDYAYRTAETIYGILGVKVWIFKGEIIPGQEDIPAPVNIQTPRRQKPRQQFEDRSSNNE